MKPYKVAKAAYGLQEYCEWNEDCDGCPVSRDDDGSCKIAFLTSLGGWYVPADWGLTKAHIERLEREE